MVINKGVMPCQHTEDGYCLREENDYCLADQCVCPHIKTTLVVLETVATCETTAEKCTTCNQLVTNPKTEC